MKVRRIVGTLATGALAVGLVGLGSPGQAVTPIAPELTVTVTGANPIIAGGATGTEFTMLVTNPNNFTIPVAVGGVPASGLTLQNVSVKELTPSTDCMLSPTDPNQFVCMTGKEAPQPQALTENDLDVGLPAKASLTVVATYLAEPWVPTSSKSFCSVAIVLGASPREFCGLTPTRVPQDLTVQRGAPSPIYTEKSTSVDVKALADLQLTSTGAAQTDPGKQASVSFQLKDLGPSLAWHFKVSFTVPDGLTLVSAGSGWWVCTPTGQKVECLWAPPPTAPAPQAALTPTFDPLPVTVKTPSPALQAEYGITAVATSDTEDPTPADATATAAIPMTPVDLAVSKSAGSPVIVDDEATWTVQVSNVGTIEDAGKVTVTDTLPAGAEFKSASAEGWTCSAQGQKVTCEHTHAVLPVGAVEDIVVVSKMTQRGAALNKVVVATTSYEKNTANNSAEKSVSVRRLAQTASALPPSPRRILSGKTDEGQKLTTRVRCTPVKSAVAGEVSYCKVRRADGVVRVRVFGSQKMKVTVVQTAKGNDRLKPFLQRKTYIVKP